MFKKLLNILLVLLLGILCVVCIGILVVSFSERQDNRRLAEQIADNSVVMTEHALLKHQTEQWLDNEGLTLRDALLYPGNDTGAVVHLYDLLHTPKLIYRVSGKMCSPCIQFGFDKLKERFGEQVFDEVLFILSDVSPREKRLIYENRCYTLREDEQLGLPLETLLLPFMCASGPEHTATGIFIPESKFPLYTDRYLSHTTARLTGPH